MANMRLLNNNNPPPRNKNIEKLKTFIKSRNMLEEKDEENSDDIEVYNINIKSSKEIKIKKKKIMKLK